MIGFTMVSEVGFSKGSSAYPRVTLPRTWRCELRDQLNIILGFAELLGDDPSTSARNRHFAENIRTAGVRLLHAVELNEPLGSGRRRNFPRMQDTA
jgi:hypothetical protein